MNDDVKTVIEKLKIVRNMAQSNETQQVCSLIIELAESLTEKQPLGFGSKDETKRPDKS